MTMKKKIAIITGSDSDLPIAEKCMNVLEKLGISYEAHIISAHRTPERARDFALNARKNDFGVIIAIAGKAAHLAGVLAAYTRLPVIGVPVKSDDLGGLDALLSTVQMPSGVPVSCVAIDGGANAGWLAARILSVSDDELAEKLEREAELMTDNVNHKDESLQEKLNREQ